MAPPPFEATCAVILAAGFSTRMQRFKPLLPFGNGSVLAHVTGTWREVGVRRIMVVGGHRGDEVERESTRLGVAFTRNPSPEDGMFSSVCAGLAAAGRLFPECRWMGVHPVDIPLVRPSTVSALVTAAGDARGRLLMPAFRGDPLLGGGHPPLLRADLAVEVVNWPGDGGLRAALGGEPRRMIPVDDPYLNMDMDRPEDYEAALSALARERGRCS